MPEKQRSLAVYCGHQFGNDEKYRHDAQILGQLMGRHKIKLVFGAGNVGLMGTVATAVIRNGGDAIGVTTQNVLDLQEPAHQEIRVEITKNLAARRQRMYDLADAFCILPGGMGTLDELTDILVKHQIGESRKPLYFINTRNFWAPFGRLFMHMDAAGFIHDPKEFHMKIFNHPQGAINEYLRYIDEQ